MKPAHLTILGKKYAAPVWAVIALFVYLLSWFFYMTYLSSVSFAAITGVPAFLCFLVILILTSAVTLNEEERFIVPAPYRDIVTIAIYLITLAYQYVTGMNALLVIVLALPVINFVVTVSRKYGNIHQQAS